MENILIIGGGNLCLEVITYLKDITVFSKRKFNLIGVVEPRKIDKKSIEDIFGKKIKQYSNLKSINFKNNKISVIIAVGDVNTREKCRLEVKKNRLKLFTLIHPKSYVASSSKIEQGCILAPFTFIATKANLEENIFINIYGSVGHHAFVGRSSVISPYANINGKAQSGKMSFLGAKSLIMPGAKLGNLSKLSAGSILYKKTKDKCLVAGNPATEITLKFKTK